MNSFLAAFIGAFLPLFVAVNIPGILPIYIGMSEPFSPKDRRRLLVRALAAGFTLAVLMLFAGDVVFNVLGITLNDLRVGGGLILLSIAVLDLTVGGITKRRAKHAGDDIAQDLPVVPLGIPLIIGPGAITTILVMQGEYGYPATLLAILSCLILVFLAFSSGPALMERLGQGTSRAIGKVASLFLAAIAVAMIRTGVAEFLGVVSG